MSKQHFIATAAIVNNISNPTTRHMVANSFANLFAGENPRFDRERFMEACEHGH